MIDRKFGSQSKFTNASKTNEEERYAYLRGGSLTVSPSLMATRSKRINQMDRALVYPTIDIFDITENMLRQGYA